MIQKGYKYRIYPNKEQIVFLEKHFGSARFLYNWGLAKPFIIFLYTGLVIPNISIALSICFFVNKYRRIWRNYS